MYIGVIVLGQNRICSMKFKSHLAFLPVFSKAMSLDSIVKRNKHVFLDNLQDITPTTVKAYQHVDFVSVDLVI